MVDETWLDRLNRAAGDLGSYAQRSYDEIARGVKSIPEAAGYYTQQYGVPAAEFAASMLPGAGFVQGNQDARTAGEAFRQGNYGQAAVSGLSSIGNTALEALGPVGHAAMAVAPAARRLYHVAPKDFEAGQPLRSLYAQHGDDAYDIFAQRWPESGNIGQDHAHKVFFYDDVASAKIHPKDGKILEIDPSGLDIRVDPEEGFKYVSGEVPPSLITILKKYGWVPGAAIPAAAVAEYQGQSASDGNDIHMASGGTATPDDFANMERAGYHHAGLFASSVPGRTDKLPVTVGEGSYILPADIVSALGEGNTLAGVKALEGVFGSHKPRFASGGGVEIIAAGGEYTVPPEIVKQLGDGDLKKGHDILDSFVKETRAKTVKTLSKLPGPAK